MQELTQLLSNNKHLKHLLSIHDEIAFCHDKNIKYVSSKQSSPDFQPKSDKLFDLDDSDGSSSSNNYCVDNLNSIKIDLFEEEKLAGFIDNNLSFKEKLTPKLGNDEKLKAAASTINTTTTTSLPLQSEETSFLLQKAKFYGVNNIKLVNIQKNENPLGATIINVDGKIKISRIVFGGAAYQSKILHESDEILEINNIPVRGRTINDVCDMLVRIKALNYLN